MSNYVRSNNGHSNGAPVLVERRSYGNLPPRALSGVWDTITGAAGKIFKGASDVYQAGKAAPPADPGYAAPAPVAPSSGIGKYAVPVAIGGAALIAIMLLRKKRR